MSFNLAPYHSHYFGVLTSTNFDHMHTLQGFVFSVNGNSTDSHVHTFKGITSTLSGHFHHFEGITGPAIPRSDGSHYHELIGKTEHLPYFHKGNYHFLTNYPIHIHNYRGTTGTEIGYEPKNW
ncbi:YmaF family protein [Anaerobacillus sp. MEB173]|uniref:YmaF family protein n=1 Tax=Anaerobacillus sp. MEB173 TaxID=3383345 RepID=UPI003F8E3F4C